MCVCAAAQAHLMYLLNIVLLRSMTCSTISNLFSVRVLNIQLFSLTLTRVAKCFNSFGKLRHLFRCPTLDLRLYLRHLKKKKTKQNKNFPSIFTIKFALSAMSTVSVF